MSACRFGGFTIRCATRGEVETCSESWEKVDIQSLDNTNVTREQMPVVVQFVNL